MGLQEKLEEQLRPLFALLEDIQGRLAKGGKVPNFGSLKDWALVSHISSSLPKLIYHPDRIPASLSTQLIVFLSQSCMICREQVERNGQMMHSRTLRRKVLDCGFGCCCCKTPESIRIAPGIILGGMNE